MPTTRTTTPRLGARALNRAALARQHLLERSGAGVLATVAHLGGLQAQEPQEPFTGLWSRLRGFDPAALSELLAARRVVRIHLMRGTVHLVTAADAQAWRPRHQAMLRQRMLGAARRELAGIDLEALAEATRAELAGDTTRTAGEIGRALAARWPGPDPRVLGQTAVALVPMVQVPPRGLWRSPGPARYALQATWSGEHDPDDAGSVGRALVRRHLAAFGPATTADVRAWSGLAGLPAAAAELRDELVTFRDDRGRELLDLPDAPRPDPDTPAPVRYLPAFDNAILGYHDRSRIIDTEHRGLSVAGQRAVLVDGRVAATWAVDDGTVVVTPLRRFTRAERVAVAEEGRELAAFLSGGESRRVRVHASPR